MQGCLGDLHDEIDRVWVQRQAPTPQKEAKSRFVDLCLKRLQECVALLWPFSRVEVFGSHGTGLQSLESDRGDLDLVVCFSDEYQVSSYILSIIIYTPSLVQYTLLYYTCLFRI